MDRLEHAQRFVQMFIDERRRDRYLSLLQTPQGLKKFERECNDLELDQARCYRLPKAEQDFERIFDCLKKKGAPDDCFVFSCYRILDTDQGNLMLLPVALRAVLDTATAGAVISCVAGRLGFYEREGANERYICEA